MTFVIYNLDITLWKLLFRILEKHFCNTDDRGLELFNISSEQESEDSEVKCNYINFDTK